MLSRLSHATLFRLNNNCVEYPADELCVETMVVFEKYQTELSMTDSTPVSHDMFTKMLFRLFRNVKIVTRSRRDGTGIKSRAYSGICLKTTSMSTTTPDTSDTQFLNADKLPSSTRHIARTRGQMQWSATCIISSVPTGWENAACTLQNSHI